jgi:hypothetical protein
VRKAGKAGLTSRKYAATTGGAAVLRHLMDQRTWQTDYPIMHDDRLLAQQKDRWQLAGDSYLLTWI